MEWIDINNTAPCYEFSFEKLDIKNNKWRPYSRVKMLARDRYSQVDIVYFCKYKDSESWIENRLGGVLFIKEITHVMKLPSGTMV